MAIITITGTPGSGKSSLAKLLAKRLGYKHHSVGDLRRMFAAEKGITLSELNRRSETGEEDTDTSFDDHQQSLAREDDVVIDSRLGFHFLPQSIKLFVDADETVRAHRLMMRDGVAESARSVEEAKRMNRARVESDRRRYHKYYGVDPFRMENYDLVLDSTRTTAEELAEQVLAQLPQLKATVKKRSAPRSKEKPL
jgi:cytidylate kinase